MLSFLATIRIHSICILIEISSIKTYGPQFIWSIAIFKHSDCVSLYLYIYIYIGMRRSTLLNAIKSNDRISPSSTSSSATHHRALRIREHMKFLVCSTCGCVAQTQRYTYTSCSSVYLCKTFYFLFSLSFIIFFNL